MNRQLIIGAVFVLAVIAYNSMFIVNEPEIAVKFKFGEIVKTDYEPGLHFKWLVANSVLKFDRRIQGLDAAPERFITSEKKDVLVDSFVKWRIIDVTTFYTATRGDMRRAEQRLSDIIKDGLRAEFAKQTLKEVVSGGRTQIMDSLIAASVTSDDDSTRQRNISENVASSLGIKIEDVRIKRIDLPDEVSHSVYERMRAERSRIASELRSEGSQASEEIRAKADRQASVIRAKAYSESEVLKGEGDRESAQVYANAFESNVEFYEFYRSLQAYRTTFRNKEDLLILDSNSDFFEYFDGPTKK